METFLGDQKFMEEQMQMLLQLERTKSKEGDDQIMDS